MAEAFGIAAGVAGFVSLLVQINSGIETLRNIRKQVDGAPKELRNLTQELQFLADIMQRVIQSAPSRDVSALQHCQTSCDEVVVLLNSLKKKFLDPSEEHGPRRLIKVLAFRQWKEAIDDLHRGIQAAKINLTLVCVLRSNTRVEELVLVNKLHLSQSIPAELTNDKPNLDYIPEPLEAPDPLTSAGSQTRTNNSISSSRLFKPHPRHNCFTKPCSCSCHHTESFAGRFWALQYTPLPAFRKACDSISCTGSRYGISLRAAFSQFGIRWAAMIGFHLLHEEGIVVLRPALGFQRVVPYTSPGFEVIWRVNWGELPAQEAQKQLATLARQDPSFKRHVNPAGMGYLEDFMQNLPSCMFCRWTDIDELVDFIKFLSDELDLLSYSRPEIDSIVGSCASIRHPHPRDEVLNVLLGNGLEPTEVGAAFVDYAYEVHVGPSVDMHFGFLQKLCSYDQEFASMSNLHEAILSGSLESAKRLMNCSENDVENPLGQTPMHLAVQHTELMKALIDHGYDIDALDDCSLTPLAYACHFNQKESVIALLEAGAGYHLYADWDGPTSCCFTIAIAEGFWDLVFCAIEALGKFESKQAARSLCLKGIKRLLHQWRTDTAVGQFPERHTVLSQLLDTLGHQSLNIHEYADLISSLQSPEDLKLLAKHSSVVATHQDHLGRNALSLVQRLFCPSPPELLEALIEHGVDVNHEDKVFQTPLRHILSAPTHSHQTYAATFPLASSNEDSFRLFREQASNALHHDERTSRRYASMQGNLFELGPLLLRLGADPTHRDRCRCSCGPQGCLPTAGLNVTGFLGNAASEFVPPLVALEFLQTLEEQKGVTVAKHVLVSFIRRVKHEQMDMTHVCCCRNPKRERYDRNQPICDWPLNGEDTDDILEEEADFIEILDREMDQLAHQGYSHLMQQWFLQLSELLKAYLANTGQIKRVFIPRHSKIVPDYEQDRYVFSLDETFVHDPISEVAKHFAYYIKGLDELYYQKYYHGYYTSRLDKHQRHQQYASRRGWLYELLRALGLSPEIVVKTLQEVGQKYTQPGETFDIEGAVDRFMNGADRGETWALAGDS